MTDVFVAKTRRLVSYNTRFRVPAIGIPCPKTHVTFRFDNRLAYAQT